MKGLRESQKNYFTRENQDKMAKEEETFVSKRLKNSSLFFPKKAVINDEEEEQKNIKGSEISTSFID